MADHTRRTVVRKIDVRPAARELIQAGMQAIPLFRKSKEPKKKKGWNKEVIELDDIEYRFIPGDNIGVVWGDGSNWIVDVDLDDDYSIPIAQVMLPKTKVYGRKLRPTTHFLYRSRNCQSAKWMDLEGKVIIEIRSSGMQSVVPPSIHPDGDEYKYEDQRVETEILSVSLKGILNRVAGFTLLAREFPPKGGRHDYISAIAGALVREGWAKDDIRLGMEGMLTAVGSKGGDREQHMKTVGNTIDHADDGDKTYGWPTLATWIDGKVLMKIQSWMAVRAVSEMPSEKEMARNQSKSESIVRLPDLMLNPPGLVGEVMRWSAKRAFVVQPILDLAVGLMCTALSSVNRFVINGWNTPLQPYLMVLAPTAQGKENSLRAVYEFAHQIKLQQFCFQGFQSYHSMLDRLAEPPSMACWLWDEAARKMKSANRAGSQDYQVLSWLLSLYGQANGRVAGLTARGAAVEPMVHPYLTVMAASQPGQFMDAVSETDLATGVINRFILLDTGDGSSMANEKREDVFPSRLLEMANAIRNRPDNGSFVGINLDVPAYTMFRSFNDESRLKCAMEGMGDIWGRANQNALIVAGLIAVGIGGSKPVIDKSVAEWAITFIRWSLGRWESRITRSTSRTRVEASSKKVEEIISNARRYVQNRSVRPKQVELLKKGFMPRSVLIGLCRHLTAKELEALIESMVEAGIVKTNEVDGGTVYWTEARN